MITFEGLDENFKFIVLEVQNQVRATYRFIREPSRRLYAKITAKDDYIDNLKTIIENKCYSSIHLDKSLDEKKVNQIRSIQIMCVNLERIADFCVNIVRQMGHLGDASFVKNYDYNPIFEQIEKALSRILDVYHGSDLTGALKICKSEHKIDDQFKEIFDHVMAELETGFGARGTIKDKITVIFIFRYLERIGDSLLNIGEALVFAILGEKIKIAQFDTLQQTLSKSGFADKFQDVDFHAIWGSRSGCRIGRVEHRGSDAGESLGGIYKEGAINKIRMEKENIDKWNSMFPGLVANVYGYNEDGGRAGMLVEFLQGCTLDEIVLSGEEDLVQNAVFIFEQTVKEIWETTKKNNPAPTDYMAQLDARLSGVRTTHPGFFRAPKRIGEKYIPSTREVIDRCHRLERELPAPFTVFIHGDCNINNMVYNHKNERLQYIDLYRSRDMDYVQDVSVFLVSNFRMPLFDEVLRARIDWIIGRYLNFTVNFAQENGDTTFEARLCLALARSFYTSTRFELNHEFAKSMYMRAHYLMEHILDHRGPWSGFKLPVDILFY